MGRKDAERFKKIEEKLAKVEKFCDDTYDEFNRFMMASKKDWQDLRNFLTQMIEGR